ncbi:MAG: ASCH domain-containing protein, partial [Mesorhizobium sp.]
MKGLIINEPWISLVLNGQKIWEMRKTQTSIRGPIALIRKGSGLIVGVVDIVDCLPTLDESEYARHENNHHIPPSRQLRARLDGWSVPWVFTNVRQLLQPVPYRHPNGAVIWVNLQPAIADTISRQLGANAPSDWQEGPEAAQTPLCQPMDTAFQSMRREEPKTTVISHPKPEPKTSPPPHASR